MKVLQVLFDMKNKNIESFKEMYNDTIFFKTIVIDINDNKINKVDTDEYDYIIFSNPNFTMDNSTLVNTLEKMKIEKKPIAQFTLRDTNYIIDYKFNLKNYRDIFSSCIVESKFCDSNDLLEVYFYVKKNLQNNNFTLVQSNYIGRDLKNNWYKEDLIHLLIKMLKYTEYNDLKKVFESDVEIVKFLDFIIDNRVFEKLINKSTQHDLLKSINNSFNKFYLLRRREYTPIYLFYTLVMKSYYDEALNSLSLYRSRRYWYHIYNKYSSEFLDREENIKNTEAWKKTQGFRDFRIKLKKDRYKIEKFVMVQLSRILKIFNKKQIWLLSERVNSASDNTYYLFEYLINNRSDIKPYYLIDKTATKPIKKLEKLGNIIYLGSLKHKLFMLYADKYITSFTFEETMTPYDSKLYKELYKKEIRSKQTISIQHGMIIHNISPYLSKNYYNIDYITANSVYEKEIIKETLGYKDEEILITGMARHDNLIENSTKNNEILFMPTWQRGLQNLNENQFIETEYFKKIYELVNDDSINAYLKSNQLKMCVLMHPQFEKFSGHFENNNNLIKYVKTSEVEIPELISNSLFLITDFSSVAVDFLFQKKNVVFYQYNKYASHHVPSKQIEYSDIGEIVSNLDEMLKSLEKIKENNYNLLQKYNESYLKLFEIKSNIRENIVEQFNNLKGDKYGK